jgi:polyhydroxybutyrate depolymerase
MVVVFPTGTMQSSGIRNWNDCRSDVPDIDHTVDDVGFISALIDDVVARHGVDGRRVYATGISNGGMMAFRLAAELPEKIAGFAPIAANEPVDPGGMCRSATQARTIVLTSGTVDKMMPYDGGAVVDNGGQVHGAEWSRDKWRSLNGTASAPATYAFPDTNRLDGNLSKLSSTAEREIYSGGLAYGTGAETAAKVVFLRIVHGGHTTPDTRYNDLPFLVVGPQNRDFDAVREIWAHLRPYRL